MALVLNFTALCVIVGFISIVIYLLFRDKGPNHY
jgi:hypothetical protein